MAFATILAGAGHDGRMPLSRREVLAAAPLVLAGCAPFEACGETRGIFMAGLPEVRYHGGARRAQ